MLGICGPRFPGSLKTEIRRLLLYFPSHREANNNYTPQITTMKRKLNENDVPVPASEGKKTAATFAQLGLDARILQAITSEKFAKPTPVQSTAIPLALSGKDILGM